MRRLLIVLLAVLLLTGCAASNQGGMPDPPKQGGNECKKLAWGFPFDVHECSYQLSGFTLTCTIVTRDVWSYEYGYSVWSECVKEEKTR